MRFRTVALGARPKKYFLALAYDFIRLRQRILHLPRRQWNSDVFSSIGQVGFPLGRLFVR